MQIQGQHKFYVTIIDKFFFRFLSFLALQLPDKSDRVSAVRKSVLLRGFGPWFLPVEKIPTFDIFFHIKLTVESMYGPVTFVRLYVRFLFTYFLTLLISLSNAPDSSYFLPWPWLSRSLPLLLFSLCSIFFSSKLIDSLFFNLVFIFFSCRARESSIVDSMQVCCMVMKRKKKTQRELFDLDKNGKKSNRCSPWQ